VLRRSDGICERCGERLVEEVHHLGPLKDNRLEQLLGVCRRCHRQLEAEKRAA
jgi:HNH endonuclease